MTTDGALDVLGVDNLLVAVGDFGVALDFDPRGNAIGLTDYTKDPSRARPTAD